MVSKIVFSLLCVMSTDVNRILRNFVHKNCVANNIHKKNLSVIFARGGSSSSLQGRPKAQMWSYFVLTDYTESECLQIRNSAIFGVTRSGSHYWLVVKTMPIVIFSEISSWAKNYILGLSRVAYIHTGSGFALSNYQRRPFRRPFLLFCSNAG